MRSLHEGWKSLRSPAKALLVTGLLVGLLLCGSMLARMMLTNGSSASRQTLELLDKLVMISLFAGLGWIWAFAIDGQRKHAAKALQEATTARAVEPDEVSVAPSAEPDRWQPDPDWRYRHRSTD
jgi:hypothetical protein